MRSGDEFGPTSLDFPLDRLCDNTPDRSLDVRGSVASLEPRRPEDSVFRPENLIIIVNKDAILAIIGLIAHVVNACVKGWIYFMLGRSQLQLLCDLSVILK